MCVSCARARARARARTLFFAISYWCSPKMFPAHYKNNMHFQLFFYVSQLCARVRACFFAISIWLSNKTFHDHYRKHLLFFVVFKCESVARVRLRADFLFAISCLFSPILFPALYKTQHIFSCFCCMSVRCARARVRARARGDFLQFTDEFAPILFRSIIGTHIFVSLFCMWVSCARAHTRACAFLLFLQFPVACVCVCVCVCVCECRCVCAAGYRRSRGRDKP